LHSIIFPVGKTFMPFKINLRLLNIFIFSAWIIALIVELTIDIPGYFGTSTHEKPFQLFYWSWFSAPKIIAIILACCAAITFFIMALLYNKIRKSKEDQYLSSLILLTMLYQGLGRVVEVYFMLAGSDLYGLVNVVGRYYYPLEILSAVIFSIVAFEVFLFSHMEKSSSDRQGKTLITISIVGTIIGVVMVFFIYITNMVAKIIIGIAGACIYFIIVFVVVITCVRIFRLSSTISEPSNKLALKVMGVQLLVLMIAIILFIISELGDFISLSNDAIYVLHAIKDGLYLVLAILYRYSFIKPSLSKKIEIS